MEKIKLSKPKDIAEAWWIEVCKKLKNATVFIDDVVAESLHWSGGLERLLNSGCKDVKEFSSFEVCGAEDEKAAFLLGGLVSGTTMNTLRVIIQSSKLKYVVIVTGAHSSVHAFSAFGGREVDEKSVMNKIEEAVLEWMHNLNYTVELFYFPLFIISPVENVFLMPQFYDVMPIFDDEVPDIMQKFTQYNRIGLEKKQADSVDELEFHHLPFHLRVSIMHLISTLHSLLQGVNAREELYSMGQLARIVAGELETYMPARQRRKVATNKVSLVFIDRTLDLTSPTDHDSSVLMNRILASLPRLPGHVIDSAIDLTPVSSIHPSCDWTLMPGCFAHQSEADGREVIEKMINGTRKETVAKINEKLKDALKLSGLDPSCEDAASGTEELQNIIDTLLSKREEESRQHFHLIQVLSVVFHLMQQGLGVIQTLRQKAATHLDQLHGLEKLLLQSLDDPHSDTSPFYQIIQLLKTRERKEINLEEILSLLVYLSSLGGYPVLEDTSEYVVTNALSQAFLEDKEKSKDLLSHMVKGEIDEVSALKTANNVWERLISISRARARFKDYRNLYTSESEMEPCRFEGLLSRVVEDCLNPPPNQLSDLEYRSAGFKDIIKTGFSLFVNVSKPRPKDAAQMIIYVLGGITPAEINQITNIVNRHNPSCEVLIGSSHFSYPQDTVRQCFNNLKR